MLFPTILLFHIYIVIMMIAVITNNFHGKEEREMFDNNRYLTCGVDSAIPLELQLFLWNCVDQLPESKDYLQVFDLEVIGTMQSITHRSEQPEYRRVYLLPSDKPITEKLYIIDDGDHSTMLLASEY